jgi:cobalt transporter subunit CbtB
MLMNTASLTSRSQHLGRILPATAAVALGLVLFLAVGFVAPQAIHNATHDTRHALGLPCH